MPTSRPRHIITETEEVTRALDDAAKRWPADAHSRSKLILRLLKEGHRAVVDVHGQRAASRREAIRHTAGALTGVYPPSYLEELRKDWPK